MRNRVLGLACLVVLVAGMVTIAYQAGMQRASGSGPVQLPGESSETLPEEFSAISDLYERISTDAVEPPDDDVLVEGALEGMLERLDDDYAVYYDPAEFMSFNELLEGSFSGVGVMLEDTPDGHQIVNVLEETPAEAAGLEEGEYIVSVDGEDMRGAPLEAVVDRVQGEEGDPVTLGLEGGSAGEREVEVVRAELDRPVLETELLGDGVGHLQVLQFTENVAERVRTASQELVAQGARGIVLDLRGNPGGLLREAVRLTSVFVEEGRVVSVRESGGREETFDASGEADALADIPLVVLVNGGSASASEIVAGAIQDLDRGEVIGEQTFGKGTVQTVRPLPGGAGVKFTTAEYFTSSGDSIEGSGIEPDRTVSEPEEQLDVAQEAVRSLLVGAPDPPG
jgi:carboxyl-terminal processing protease